MTIYEYTTTDGRIVLSETPLNRAIISSGKIDLKKVPAEDIQKATIVPNRRIAEFVKVAMNGSDWVPAETLVSMQKAELVDCSVDRNYCIIQNGEIHILSGFQYVPLSQITLHSSKNALRYALRNVAFQAALAQIELSGLHES